MTYTSHFRRLTGETVTIEMLTPYFAARHRDSEPYQQAIVERRKGRFIRVHLTASELDGHETLEHRAQAIADKHGLTFIAAADQALFMTIDEVAVRWHMSKMSASRLIRSEVPGGGKFGRLVRVLTSEVEAYELERLKQGLQ